MSTYAYTPEPGPPLTGARIRFEAIGEAFNLIKAQPVVWMVTILIYLGIVIGISFGMIFLLSSIGLAARFGSTEQPAIGPRILGNIISTLVNIVPTAFFVGGLYRMALKQVRGGTIAVGDLFSASDRIVPLIGGQLLNVLSVYAGLFLCVIPGFIVAGRLMFLIPLIVDKGLSPVDAYKMSWNALKTDLLTPIAFLFVVGIVSGLGALACGIGILFTAPIAQLAVCIVYEDNFGTNGKPDRAAPTIEMPLPPGSVISQPTASEQDRPGEL